MNLFGFSISRQPSLTASAGDGGVQESGVSDPLAWFKGLVGGGKKSSSGAYVSRNTALRVTAVYAAVRVISESMASLPCKLMQKSKDNRRSVLTGHPLYNLINESPTDGLSAFEFAEMSQAQMCLDGNSYSYIERDGRGEVVEIVPILSGKVNPRRNKNRFDLVYDVDGEAGLPARKILHLKGFSLDGITGLNPISLARESIGLAIAAERMGSEAFGDGYIPPVVLEVAERADKEKRKEYRTNWVSLMQDRRSGPPVISGGMKLHTLRLSLADLQFIESRKYSVTEIARLFRLPPHMLADLERATFSNIEHLSIEFVKYTLAPWIKRWEQRLNMQLLTETDRARGMYFKFNVDAFLRGDIKTRYEAHKIGRDMGVLSPNEIREMEDRDPYPGGDGYIEPMNMWPVGVPRIDTNPQGNHDAIKS